jgi:hypothetical protein
MKKMSVMIVCILMTVSGFGQETPTQEKQKKPVFSMGGGVWLGANGKTTFLGFVGPKLSMTFPVSPQISLEAGVNGVPGVILSNDPKFGLAMGTTLTLRHAKTKCKPIIGVMFLKTETWQVLYGVGFLF